ncbi:SPOR domain-containing protein [Acidovorax sp. 106]|uniref:SPOR domain-containing protein n=1 Tax=Acidovorax sp. 106 TaxID=2135637 RepID=UPI001F303635|nr:SPOR domain-containing protein [Acidovorax sp. 106]
MSLDSPSDSAVTTLYRAALGPVNTERYVQAFARLDAMGRTLTSWHWAACFFTLGWMVYRQLWGAALVYVAAAEGVALLVFGLGRPLLQWPQAVEWGVVGAFAILGSVVPGLYAHAILHADIRKRVTKALAASANIPEACDLLAKQAVSRKRLTWVIAGHALLAGAALLAYLVFPQGTFTGESPAQAAPAQAAAPSASWNTPSPTLTPASRPVAEEADMAAAQPKPQPPSSAPTVAGDAEDVLPAATVAAAPQQSLAVKPAAAPADKAPANGVNGANGANRAKGASQATASVADKAPEKTPAKPADKPVEKSAEKPAAKPTEKATEKATEKPTEKPADKAKEAPASKASAQQAAASKAVAAKASEPTRAKPVPAGKTPAASSAARQAEGKASAASGVTVGTAPGFYINVGLFADESNARKAQSRLLNEGLPAFRQTLDSAKGTRTRVRVGPFASRSEAESAASSVRALELDAVIFQK